MDPLKTDLSDGIVASVEGVGKPTTSEASASSAEAEPVTIDAVEEPTSSTEDTTSAEDVETVETVEEVAEPEPPGFDWEAWDGELETAPEEHRTALTAFSARVSAKHATLLEEQDAIIQRYDDFLRESKGEDPRVVAKDKELQKIKDEFAAVTGKIQALEKDSTLTRAEMQTKLDAAMKEIDASELKHSKAFIKAHPELQNTPARKEKTIALLRDEEIAWELDDLPKLIDIPPAKIAKIKSMLLKGDVGNVDIALKVLSLDVAEKPDRADPSLVGTSKGASKNPGLAPVKKKNLADKATTVSQAIYDQLIARR
jgi:hypothetical protein